MEKRPRDPAFAERLKKLLKQKGIKNNNQFALAIKKAPIVTHGWMRGKVPDIRKTGNCFVISSVSPPIISFLAGMVLRERKIVRT
jgi:hypothetical protein